MFRRSTISRAWIWVGLAVSGWPVAAPTTLGATEFLYVTNDQTPGGTLQFTLPLTASSTANFALAGNVLGAAGLDTNGTLAIGDFGGNISIFAPPIEGTSGPYATFKNGSASSTGQLVFNNGQLWAAGVFNGVNAFAPPFSNSSTPTVHLTPAGATQIFGLGFDSAQNLYLSNINSIYVFAPPYNGSPIIAPAPANTNYRKLALSGNQLFVSMSGSAAEPAGRVEVYNLPITASSAPAFFMKTGINIPEAVAFDSSGNLYVGNLGDGTIAVFNPPFSPSSAPALRLGPLGSSFAIFSIAIGAVGSNSPLLAATLPSSRSVQVGNPATAFATILNSGAAATACGIEPITGVPATFNFQTTDPNTNQLTGTPNTLVNIPAGGLQTFVVGFVPSGAMAPTDVNLSFACANVPPVAPIVGVNTLAMTFSTTPVPDVITIGLTPSRDGFSRTGGPTGTGLFVIATSNIGASGNFTVRVRPSTSMPLAATICQTNPQNGQCLQTPTPTVSATINQNQNSTWAAFLQASGTINPDPKSFRVFFEFVDAGGVLRGSTSTAVTTQ